MKQYTVYILASRMRGTLYIGMTNDLARRMSEHRTGNAPGFTKKYGVFRLVRVETFNSLYEARTQENRLKHWNRAWKIKLIEETNSNWDDLGEQFNL